MAIQVVVTQFQATDGSIFLTEHEADAHDFKLENGAKIEVIVDAFLNTTGAIDRSRNMQKNTIEAFLAFHLPRVAAGTDLEPVERTVFDTPKPEKEAAAEAAAAEVAADAVSDEAPQTEQPVF